MEIKVFLYEYLSEKVMKSNDIANKAIKIRNIVEQTLEEGNGILNLKPAWVAHTFLSGGRRLGLKDPFVSKEKGWINERWLGSTTLANPGNYPEDEGVSYFRTSNGDAISLKKAIEHAGDLIMGVDYTTTHQGLERLAKIFDYDARLPFHLHQMEEHARLVGRNPKEEAYYFPEEYEIGPHPETFFGVHPYITDKKKYNILLPHLVDWKDDLILRHSRAYQQMPGEGFHVKAGVLHAPGTALTIELQEESVVFAMFQALAGGKIIPKELLYKDVRKKDRNEKYMLTQVNWEVSGDPYFFENHHTYPHLIEESVQKGGQEWWIFYNTTKFSGKKMIVKPGKSYNSLDKGVYNIFVLSGKGDYGGHLIEARNPGLDELLISYKRAVKPLVIKNIGKEELKLIKFFGPDINLNIPVIKKYKI